MIQITGLSKTFVSGDNSHKVLNNINLQINDGDILGIIGQSGAGKSTLVRCLNLLETPDCGGIEIDGVDITQVSKRELLAQRSNIGMIFQNFALFEQRSVPENVLFPLVVQGRVDDTSKTKALELIDRVGLADKADYYPSQLSGGQKQRVAIARALISNPSTILCDEATSALDAHTTNQILDLLSEINQELKVTIVIITHSLSVAQRICNKVAVIDKGEIVEMGDTLQVFANPKTVATKSLVSESSGGVVAFDQVVVEKKVS